MIFFAPQICEYSIPLPKYSKNLTMGSIKYILFLSLVLSACATSKHAPLEYNFTTYDNLKTHVTYLADDKMEGRRAGTAGEKMARYYISNQFAAIGLEPKGSDGFFQPFDINEGKMINAGTTLTFNDTRLEAGDDMV